MDVCVSVAMHAKKITNGCVCVSGCAGGRTIYGFKRTHVDCIYISSYRSLHYM